MTTYAVTRSLAALDQTSPRKRIILNVLERAKDAGDQTVIAACRRLLNAETIGFRTHATPADRKLVAAFAND
jgi:hypothetical protein